MYNNNYGKGVDFLLYSALHWGFLKKQCFLQLSFLGGNQFLPYFDHLYYGNPNNYK